MLKLTSLVLVCAALAVPVLGQRRKLDLNAQTPEGQLLQQAAQADDDASKLKLYEEYLSKYPQHDAVPWVYDQVAPMYLKAGQLDKVLEGAEASLAADPANPVIAYQALQACEQKKDGLCIKKWSAATADAAQKVLESKKPEDEAEAEEWKRDVDYAQQVTKRTEYSLYAGALQATDAATTVDLYDELARRHPQSEYLPQAAGRYFLALRQSGQEAKAIDFAEKIPLKEQDNEDMLLVVANRYMDQKTKDPDKVLAYSARLVEVMNTKAAPEGVAPADWDKRKNSMLGLGYWMQGMTYGGQNKWAPTDKAFRAALPYIQGNNDLLAPAYFFLGLSNYRMAEGPKGNKTLLADAKKYSVLAAGIKSPYQAAAQKNVAAMGGR